MFALAIVGWYVAVTGYFLISRWLKPKPQDKRVPRGKNLEIPRAKEGDPLPVFWGRVRIDSPILVWNGLHYLDAIDPDGNHTNMASMLFSLGVPPQPILPGHSQYVYLHRTWLEDKKIGLGSGLSHTDIKTASNGTVPTEDGFSFIKSWLPLHFQFFDGRATQTLVGTVIHSKMTTPYLIGNPAVPTAEVPGYRGQCTVAMTGGTALDVFGWNIGTSLRPPRVSFEIEGNTFSAGSAAYDKMPTGDANPVAVIVDILCGSWGKLKLDSSKIDTVSFAAAAQTLFEENHGYSRVLYDPDDAAETLFEIMRQIDGVLWESPEDGKIHIKLLRDDLGTILDLPLLNEDNVEEVTAYNVSTWEDLYQQVRVNYTDRYAKPAYQTKTVQAIAPGTDAAGARTMTLDVPGCTNIELAQAIAERELRDVSRPLVRISLLVNRDAFDYEPGDGVRFSWADYNVSNMVMRVQSIDLGSPDDERIRVELIQDSFNVGAVFASTPNEVDNSLDNTPYPIAECVITESPRWINYRASVVNRVNNPDYGFLLALAVPRGNNQTFRVNSKYSVNDVQVGNIWANDLRHAQFPSYFEVETEYDRTEGPYDTVTGLRIEFPDGADLTEWDTDSTASINHLAFVGRRMIQVGDEIMLFTHMTNVAGNVWKLHNVWRDVLDTCRATHAVGTRGFLIGNHPPIAERHYVGTFGTPLSELATEGDRYSVEAYPSAMASGNQGEDREDNKVSFEITQRQLRPAPAANLATTPADGEDLEEGGIDLTWANRNRNSVRIMRADEPSIAVESDHDYEVWARNQRTGQEYFCGNVDGAEEGVDQINIAAAGTDLVDVMLRSVREGVDRFGDAWRLTSWQDPTVTVDVQPWRNLLTNFDLSYNDPSTTPSHGWVVDSGTVIAYDTAFKTMSENFKAFYASAGTAVFHQTVDLTGYDPARMRAVLMFYGYNGNADADDTVTAVLTALDADDVSLGTVTYAATVQSNTEWLKRTLNYTALPNDTRKIKVTFTLTRVGGSGSDPCYASVQYPALYVGQFSDELLTDGDFESGTLAGWTNVSGTFVNSTSGEFEGSNFARANSTAEYYQEVAIPTGYNHGLAMLRIARRGSGDDTAEVILEARSSAGGAVVATTTTGAEVATASGFWEWRYLAFTIPGTATHLRVRLVSTQVGGAFTGQDFDAAQLRCFKELNPPFEFSAEWTSPKVQPIPATWEQFHLAYPEISVPSYFWDGVTPEPQRGRTIGMQWGGDNVANASLARSQAFHGAFGETEEECRLNCYEFERGEYAIQNAGDSRALNFRSDQSFTVGVWLRLAVSTMSGVGTGIIGRCDPATYGWYLEFQNSGVPRAVLQGRSGTKTAAGTHLPGYGVATFIAMRYNADDEELILSMRNAAGAWVHTTTSTSSNLGDFKQPGAIPFYLGNATEDHSPFSGQIARVYAWEGEALTDAEIESLDVYGTDPSGHGFTFEGDPCSYNLPGGYSYHARPNGAPFHNDESVGDTGWCLYTGANDEDSFIPTWDEFDWVAAGAATLTRKQRGPDGLARAIQISNCSSNSDGAELPGMDNTAAGPGQWLHVNFRAKSTSGAQTARVILLNGTDPGRDVSIGAADEWAHYVAVIEQDGAVGANDSLLFKAGNGETLLIDPGSVVATWRNEDDTDAVRLKLFAPGTGATGTAALLATVPSVPASFGHEGEIDFEAIVFPPNESVPDDGLVFDMWTLNMGAPTDDNRRTLNAASGVLEFDHFDGAGVVDTSTVNFYEGHGRYRARWCNLTTLDNDTTPFAGVRTYDADTGVFQESDYGRGAAWAQDPAVIPNEVEIGTGFRGGIRALTIRSREEKIQGD